MGNNDFRTNTATISVISPMETFKKEALTLTLILGIPILVLTALAIISSNQARDKANLLQAREDLHDIKQSLYSFKRDVGRYPNLKEGLLALVRAWTERLERAIYKTRATY
jgi:hypothetical protein